METSDTIRIMEYIHGGDMEKKEFKTVLGNVLRKYGFEYKNKAYYQSNNKMIIVIATQKSNFDESYYVNYGIFIKEINSSLEYPRENVCDIRGRFIFHSQDRLTGEFNIRNNDIEELERGLTEMLENVLMPVYARGIGEYYKILPESIPTATLKTREYLGMV